MNKFFNKRRAALLLTATMGVSIVAGMFATTGTPKFSDVPNSHWAYSYVDKAAENGWVTGIGNGKFGVDQQVTYAELCTMVVRAFYPELPEQWGGSATNRWWEPYYYGIASMGLDRGTRMEKVDDSVPAQPVDRYEMAQLLYNVLKEEGKVPSYDASSVQASIGDWASVPSNYRDALMAVVSAGMITGVDDKGTFNGNGLMTRAQAAVVMCRMAEVMGTVAPVDPTDPPEPTEPSGELGQKLSNGATAAAGVKSQIGKDDTYPTYGNSDVVSNNGYYTGATNVDIGTAQLQYEFLEMVNEAREAEGHEPLAWVSSDAAEEHTLQRCYELVSNFSHDRPKGKFSGEVCGKGYMSAGEAFNGWMNSPGHKQTLMSDTYSYMTAARAGNYWIICVWTDVNIENVEQFSIDNYDESYLYN